MAFRGWRVRGLAWLGVWVSIPATGSKCQATLMSSDRTKQICLWMTIYSAIRRKLKFFVISKKLHIHEWHLLKCTSVWPWKLVYIFPLMHIYKHVYPRLLHIDMQSIFFLVIMHWFFPHCDHNRKIQGD